MPLTLQDYWMFGGTMVRTVRLFAVVVVLFAAGTSSFAVPRLSTLLDLGKSASRTSTCALRPSLKNSRGRALGLSMQADLQWHQFSGFNLGRWKGRALHIDPETGDYVQPYIIRDYMLDVIEEQGEARATERFVGEQSKTLEPVVEETAIVANDELDASGDGYYSTDRCLASHPDVNGMSSFSITMSIPLSDFERVRCDICYDMRSQLQRIILFQERRISFPGEGSEDESTEFVGGGRGPLSLQDFIGSFAGEALSRRSWRLGGGTLKYRSKGSALWDGETSVRREMEVVDDKNSSRSVSWGTVDDAYSLVVKFEGSELVFLPGGCWVSAPTVLLDGEGEPVEPLSALDMLRETSQVEAAKKTLELALGVDDGREGGRGGGKDLQPFMVEFGIQLAEKDGKEVRYRAQRVYGKDGYFNSAVSVEETRTG